MHSSWRLHLVCALREVLRRYEELGSEEEGAGRGKQVAKSKGRKENQKGGGRVSERAGKKHVAGSVGEKRCSWREGQSEAKQLVCSGARILTQLCPL